MQLFYKPMNNKQKAALNALADGIECGSKLRPQAFNGLVKNVMTATNWYEPATCALGAAKECALVKQGITDEDERLNIVRECTDYGMILADYGVRNRMADRRIVIEDKEILARRERNALSTLVFRLNDHLKWTREQIAAFLRECE